jgi:hypothetical protein
MAPGENPITSVVWDCADAVPGSATRQPRMLPAVTDLNTPSIAASFVADLGIDAELEGVQAPSSS